MPVKVKENNKQQTVIEPAPLVHYMYVDNFEDQHCLLNKTFPTLSPAMSFLFFCFGVGLAVIYLSLLAVIRLTHDRKEPPLMIDWIPFFSPIIGVIIKRWRYFLSLG